MTVTGNLQINVSATVADSINGVSYSGSPAISVEETLRTPDYTLLFFKTDTISSTDTIDVTSLTDPFGNAISFTEVKAIVVVNESEAKTLTVGGGTDPLIAAIDLSVSGSVCLKSDVATSGTVKNILLTPSDELTYQILIVGN